MMLARENGKLAYLNYDKLKIDGVLYVYDDVLQDIKPLRGTTSIG